jgi:hypothetical protein
LSVVFSQYSYSNAWSEIQILKEEWMREWMNTWIGREGLQRVESTRRTVATPRGEMRVWFENVIKAQERHFLLWFHELTMDNYAIELALKASIIERRCFSHTMSKAIAT